MAEDKELPASAKRRAELREKGQVARSQDLTTTGLLAAGLGGLIFLGPGLGRGLAQLMSGCFQQIGKLPQFQEPTQAFSFLGENNLIGLMALFLGIIFIVAIAVQVSQVGLIISETAMDLNLDRLNPLNGIQQLFSVRKLVSTAMSLVKLLIIVLFAWSAMKQLISSDVFTRPVTAPELAAFLLTAIWAIGWRVIIGLAVIASVDYLYQHWQFEKEHRMSLEEVKDEFKQSEGSPEVKARRRSQRRKKTFRRMLEDVSDATIVVTNPTHYAIALQYKRGETPIPIIVAKGVRRNALLIKEQATRYSIPMMENRPLAQGLFKHGQVGEPIPVLYYQGVAQLLAQLFRRGFRSAPEEKPPTGGPE